MTPFPRADLIRIADVPETVCHIFNLDNRRGVGSRDFLVNSCNTEGVLWFRQPAVILRASNHGGKKG